MSKAQISSGTWQRNVPWKKGGVWRTDMFKSVLSDQRLTFAEFFLKDGPKVRISAEELKRVLIGGADHYDGKIWGPFNIDPQAKTLAGKPVKMSVQ